MKNGMINDDLVDFFIITFCFFGNRAIGEDKIKIGDDDEVENEVEESSDIGAAWHDDDDDEVEIDLMKKHKTKKLRDNPDETVLTGSLYEDRLRKQFENLHETPEWATVVSTEDDEDDILRSTSSLVSSKSKNLPKTVIGLTRMKDANVKDPCWVCYLDYSVFVIFLNEKIIYIFDIEHGKTSKISSNNSFIVNCWI